MPDQSHRDHVLDEAVRAGKFLPSRREHYARLYDADPQGTTAWIEQLACVLPLSELGTAATGETFRTQPPAEPAYPKEWLGDEFSRPPGRITYADD